MDEFETLFRSYRSGVERFVKFRLPSLADAEDVLQDIAVTAYEKFSQLKNKEAFQAWVLGIARNKCIDYFRRKAKELAIPLEEVPEQELTYGRHGVTVADTVREALNTLADKDKQVLYLYFWKELPQAEIAKCLGIPVGTVKSRLHTAKQNFKKQYPYQTEQVKGEETMKTLPKLLPNYTIEKTEEAPFSVKWEELIGWFLVPKLGESLSWGMYDMPSRECNHVYDMKVTGKAMVHGIEGVELTAREASYSGKREVINRTFVAQLTDTHCRYLATMRTDGDIRNYITFLDGDAFMTCWGFGEDNCGNETNLSPKGDIKREGNIVTSADKEFLLDIVGRYTVTIGGKKYDTVCVMDIETYNAGVVSEQFLDKNGRTVLWRRFNRDDWAFDHYGKKWSQQLPENDKLVINGVTYVEWYDCMTEYVL